MEHCCKCVGRSKTSTGYKGSNLASILREKRETERQRENAAK